jgi:hypothetical protein
MSASDQRWKVLPHGRLTAVDDDIMTVVGDLSMPLTRIPRRMTVVRLRDGRLVVFSAIALDDESMAVLESFGRPAFLIVPNGHHRLDAPAWKARFPDMQVVAPAGARSRVQKVVAVDTTTPAFGDAGVDFVPVAGTREHEAALVVRKASGVTLVLNDIVGNVRNARGIGGAFLRLMGFAGDRASIPLLVRRVLVKDRSALRLQLLEWAGIVELKRVLVSHGEPIEGDARQTLRTLAESLT